MARAQKKHPPHLHVSAYGGILRNRRCGRGKRTVSTRYSMHLVLRSSQARGVWSLVRPKNRDMISRVLTKHARRTQAKILGIGNAGNHLHLRVQFMSRELYLHFIRAVAGEIALHIKRIANISSGTHANTNNNHGDDTLLNQSTFQKRNFWDHRPFSSIVATMKYAARLADYIVINNIEGQGYPRAHARLVVQAWRDSS
ncbi:MAG: hypothetical protein A2Z20_03905 [Bdellovibrionales bacterium RBG_16_40_8]|nr:MAG: hypothetical protein A2Z20_03905 [Bdellovibrionales bacterium RBG_16_40_8]